MHTDFSTGKVVVMSEKHCVTTENRDVSIFLFHSWHTEGLNQWEDGEGEHMLVEPGLPLHSQDQGPGHHTMRQLAFLTFLTLTFHFLPVPEPCTLC